MKQHTQAAKDAFPLDALDFSDTSEEMRLK